MLHPLSPSTDLLDLINLTPLMARTEGCAEVIIGLIDGPVALDHPALAPKRVRVLDDDAGGACNLATSAACRHGTLVAGVLVARRETGAAAVCPGCTLLVRPIFTESQKVMDDQPAASPGDLAVAIRDCIAAGATIINISAALLQPSLNGERALQEALDLAARRGVIVAVAAGNQGAVGGTAITRHPWAIAVAACDERGKLLSYTNLGGAIGRRGLLAPGKEIAGLDSAGGVASFSGTSAATPLVTGTAALLRSEFPRATGAQIRMALAHSSGPRRASVVPPLVNAWGAYLALAHTQRRVA